MSNFLSVAVVTEAFRQVLMDAVNAAGIPGASVTAVRPTSGANNGQPGNPPSVGVNLFLYQVTPNAAFRNMDAPARRSDGSLLQPTRSAYDLHYLLTFYGSESSYEAQRMLGSVLRALHSAPVLTHKRLESVKNMPLSFFAASNMEVETETVKLTLTPLNLEELSKLWSVFFQTTYNLSLAFQASVVIIDGTEVTSPALPVLSRNIYIRPFQQPLIEQVLSQKLPNSEILLQAQPIIVGDTIVLQGKRLRSDPYPAGSLAQAVTRVRLGDLLITPSEVSETQIKFVLGMPPFPANALRAGVQGLQVEQSITMGTPKSEHIGNESNVVAFVLHPVVTVSAKTISKRVAEDLAVTICTSTITLKLSPPVGLDQRVVLLLNELDPPASRSARAYRFDVPVTPLKPLDTFTTQLTRVVDVAAGKYLVRVQVDGAESLLDPGPDPDNPLFASPKVTIS
jgi:hypothetical protein